MATKTSKIWYSTQTQKQTIQFRWSIENVRLRRERVGQMLRSPSFSSDSDASVRWALVVYLKGYNPGHSGFISVFLERVKLGVNDPVKADYQFSLLDSEDTEVATVGFMHTFLEAERRGVNNFVSLEKLNEFSCDKEMVFTCTICYLAHETSYYRDTRHEPLPDCQLSANMGQLLDSASFSDVVLELDDGEVPAHRAVLAARSAVFAAMFQHAETKETREGRVRITDLTHNVVKTMLQFIYTGQVEDLDEAKARDLLPAADKYALDRLKMMCAYTLLESLDCDNAVDLLILADLHSVPSLRNEAIRFISGPGPNRDSYRALTSHPRLLAELALLLLMCVPSVA